MNRLDELRAFLADASNYGRMLKCCGMIRTDITSHKYSRIADNSKAWNSLLASLRPACHLVPQGKREGSSLEFGFTCPARLTRFARIFRLMKPGTQSVNPFAMRAPAAQHTAQVGTDAEALPLGSIS